MTASKGDFVMTTADQEKWKKDVIASVALYRASPAVHNGEIVESAQAWIDAGSFKPSA